MIAIIYDSKKHSTNEEILALATEHFADELGIPAPNNEFEFEEKPTDGMIIYNYRTNAWYIMVAFNDGERSAYIDLDERFTVEVQQ